VTPPESRSTLVEKFANDEYFSVSLGIARQKLSDIRSSITSSVWRPAYRKALQTLPNFDLSELDFAIPQCDACHLGGRLSKFVARLSGTPYDRSTFESLEEPSDSDSSDRPANAEFHLGRFCAQRTRIFHELSHWEFALFRSLTDELDRVYDRGASGHLVYVAFSKSVKPPEDPTDADQLVEWLDERGIVQTEWLRVKQLMASATKLDVDMSRGGGDDA